MNTITSSQTVNRIIAEGDLDRLLAELNAQGLLVLSARRLGDGTIRYTIGPAPRRPGGKVKP
jgi:hypothetical protein